MGANSFGKHFKITTFGESHGQSMGVIIDGCPAGLSFDDSLLKFNLSRRRPGQSSTTTSREEKDQYKILSGVFEGKTLGSPITLLVENQNKKSSDYDKIKSEPRVGHADDVWKSKFGHYDHRGGGRASGRETVSRVLGGSVAQMLVTQISKHTQVVGLVSSVFNITLSADESVKLINSKDLSCAFVNNFDCRFPNKSKSLLVKQLLEKAKYEGESFGGIATLVIKRPQKNLGQPVFNKLKSELSAAFMSVGAVTGVEMGLGFAASQTPGTEFHSQTSNYGGLRGGISTGEDIVFKIAFKPTSSIGEIAKKGRHDPCIVPRAIPVLESMCWLVLADQMLLSKADKI